LVKCVPSDSQWELISCLAVPSYFLYKPELSTGRLLYCLLYVGFLLGLFFNPHNGSKCPPKHRLIFNELHGVLSQKIQLFIATTLRTSNPIKDKNLTT
jgi:hypothetical protein